jgi:hypothetical protein
VLAIQVEFQMKILTTFLAGAALLALSTTAMAQTGGMSGGSSGGSIGPATGTPGQFPRPRGAESPADLTGSGVTGTPPDANRSDNDQAPGRRRPPVSPGNNTTAVTPGAGSETPASIIAPPSPFGAR